MASDWNKLVLRDLIDVKHGFAFKGEYMQENLLSGPVVVAIGNFDYSGGFRFSETRVKRYTSEYPVDYVLSAGDMLLAMTCQTSGGEILGIPGIIPDDDDIYLHNQRLGKVIINKPELVCPDYLYWLFLSRDFNQFIFQRATGTKILHTSPKKILEYETAFPSLLEQKLISRALWSIQDKITLNRQINQTLEQMAQTLFKSWFVDFDPVMDNALDAGNPIPDELQHRAEARKAVRESEGFKPLPDDVRQLFPDAFEESELGWVPKGWDVTALGNLVTVKRGGSPRPIKDFIVPEGLPWVKISDATSSACRFLSETKEFIREEGLKKTVYLKSGSLILSNSATPGLPKFLDLDACIHDGWLYFPHKEKLSDKYLYQLFEEIRPALVRMGNGSVFTNLKTDILKAHQLLVASENVLTYFDDQLANLHKKIHSVEQESRTLTKLRDTLLPKLISGELRLDEIEAAVE
ncbi:restriction endonuclease subunit S [Vibrio cholerae]|uniref:restriction endonuclease subunit S n=1 Tax=Vibrio cholerae TaxID=666 RepID=UPI00285705B6|nr:restriction endonuclease subunit S [Vibrio cholerae]EJL6306986.1 restriction endonuclease subunit S [Vibrio cholerae]ELD8763463.1 restriction endonuclease subunit S [Vibrio cholerae]ELT5926893.1 restriction endonuclease subunit S [Vibrio cholerae]HDI3291822.1 restriction endonuclease subunit S [Vibrio cholerae]